MLRHLGVILAFVMTASASPQDPLRAFPANYWVELDTPSVRVIHVRYRPHEEVGIHDHPATPTLYVYLSDSGPVRFEHAGHDDFDLTRPPLKAGQMRVSPGRLETHRVENLGDQQTDFLRVELRALPLGMKSFEKRIPAPGASFWQQSHPEEVVFDDPHLRVVRLAVSPHATEILKGIRGTSTVWLAVAVEGATVNSQPAHSGEAWSAQTLQLTAQSAPAEVVRLDLK